MVDNQCVGSLCNHTLSMPLLDSTKATLKADIDVSEMNKFLKTYIHQEIKAELGLLMKDSVEELVNGKIEQAKKVLEQTLKGKRSF